MQNKSINELKSIIHSNVNEETKINAMNELAYRNNIINKIHNLSDIEILNNLSDETVSSIEKHYLQKEAENRKLELTETFISDNIPDNYKILYYAYNLFKYLSIGSISLMLFWVLYLIIISSVITIKIVFMIPVFFILAFLFITISQIIKILIDNKK